MTQNDFPLGIVVGKVHFTRNQFVGVGESIVFPSGSESLL
jgi:hypothetical protein